MKVPINGNDTYSIWTELVQVDLVMHDLLEFESFSRYPLYKKQEFGKELASGMTNVKIANKKLLPLACFVRTGGRPNTNTSR